MPSRRRRSDWRYDAAEGREGQVRLWDERRTQSDGKVNALCAPLSAAPSGRPPCRSSPDG